MEEHGGSYVITVHGGKLLLFTGDSITAAGWPEVAGGFVDQINAQIPTVVAPRYSVPTTNSGTILRPGSTSSTVRAVSHQSTIRTVNTGIAGNQTSDIAAAVPTRITNYNPDIIVILIGINDCINSISLGTSTTNYTSILTQIRAWSSTVQIACLSLLCYGEHWASGPLSWGPNAPALLDGPIAAFNSMVQGLCVTYNCTYVDARTPLLTWESQNNTPEPGLQNGPFAGGGPHPLVPSGQILLGGWVLPSFTVIP
jgi:hypothetical protein